MAAAAAVVKDALRLPVSPMARMRALLTDAWLHLADGDWAAIARDVDEALAIPRATGNRQLDLVGITFMNAVLAAVPGCLELTERYCAEAAALAPPDTAWRLGADELSIWPLIWRGRTDEALARAEAAEALRQRLDGFPFVGNDLPAQLTVLYLARGDAEAAGRAVDTLLQRLPNAARMRWSFYLHAAGRALALLGRHAEAHTVHLRLAQSGDGRLTQYLSDHLAGLLALLQGRYTEAGPLLERAAQVEGQLPIARIGGSARLLQARLLLEQGRTEAARSAAAAVLGEWERAGIPGCALLDGPVVQPVLSPETAAAPQATGLAALPEPLTERELDVLRLLVAGRTNPQIAATLYVTVETVKTHVAHILRKLDVTSRTQAATRGRELGL
jgi:LuxR family maltose regulon positive regulatory protein